MPSRLHRPHILTIAMLGIVAILYWLFTDTLLSRILLYVLIFIALVYVMWISIYSYNARINSLYDSSLCVVTYIAILTSLVLIISGYSLASTKNIAILYYLIFIPRLFLHIITIIKRRTIARGIVKDMLLDILVITLCTSYYILNLSYEFKDVNVMMILTMLLVFVYAYSKRKE